MFPEIPGYKFIKNIGRGGMAEVYLAVQKKLNRMVAIKVLIPEVVRNSYNKKRFIREARTVSKLIHPNIVTIYDVGKVENSYYMVMEFLHESLKERIKSCRRINPEETMHFIKQIAGALFYAHRVGFVHRDIKPENILFRKDGTPVLLDFGIARAMDSSTRITKTGISIGTPNYISPEQAKGEKVDGRSDIYGLGVVLFEMLTGKVPYDSKNPLGVILKHIQEPVPRLPKGLEKFQILIDRMMEKDKRKRLQSEEQLHRIIKSLLGLKDDKDVKIKKETRRSNYDISARTQEVALKKITKQSDIKKKGKYKNVEAVGLKPTKRRAKLIKYIIFILSTGFLILMVLYSGFLKKDSIYRVLDTEDVKSMIRKHDFFDSIWNKFGKSIHKYKKEIIDNDFVVIDAVSDLMWHHSGSSREMEFQRAKQWIRELNNRRYAGFKDWRFPTLKEAAALLNNLENKGFIHIDSVFSKGQTNIWTGDKYGSSGCWVVRFDEGYTLGHHYDYKNYVRPVRSLKK